MSIKGQENLRKLFTNLEQHSLYITQVKFESDRPFQRAVLITGFSNGVGWFMLPIGYQSLRPFDEVFEMDILLDLGRIEQEIGLEEKFELGLDTQFEY